MTALATLPVVLGTGIHSARPAAADVGSGGLYSCTTHSLVYQTDGTTWTTWATLGGGTSGALILLEQHTANNTSTVMDFTTFISSTYDTYKIEVVELVLATSTASFIVIVGTGGGPTYDTGNNYEWARLGYTSGAAANNDAGATGGPGILFKSMSVAAGYGFGTASFTVTGLQSTALRKTFHGTAEYVTSVGPAAIYAIWGMQWVTTGTAATALRFNATAGNIVSGTIRIYGVAK